MWISTNPDSHRRHTPTTAQAHRECEADSGSLLRSEEENVSWTDKAGVPAGSSAWCEGTLHSCRFASDEVGKARLGAILSSANQNRLHFKPSAYFVSLKIGRAWILESAFNLQISVHLARVPGIETQTMH